MIALTPAFRERAAFLPPAEYILAPFRFNRVGARDVVVNDVGEHVVLSRTELVDLVQHNLNASSELYRELRSKHIVLDVQSRSAIELLALKHRSRTAL